MTTPPSLSTVLRRLRACYGPPPRPVSTDPFQLILWEQVGYLVPDATRLAAYRALRTRIGLSPAAILGASTASLLAVARLGGSIAAPTRAARMRASAEQVIGKWDGKLATALTLPPPLARRALAAFPMIGEPGADKILAIAASARLLPLDSNALRVLQRLGLVGEAADYRRSYQAAQGALQSQLPRTAAGRVAGGMLLRRHGQELCRRSAPVCPGCPLRADCPTGRLPSRRSPAPRHA